MSIRKKLTAFSIKSLSSLRFLRSLGFLGLLFGGFVALPQKTRAQETEKVIELNPVNIVGQRSKSIPGSNTYIDNEKLRQLNQTNINNVLKTVPGVTVRDEEGFGLRPNISLRGTKVDRSARITLMEDGILIAPAPYADPSAYYFPTFSRMEGVEILKGSSQIKYGPYTIGGAINLLSTSIPESFKGHALLSYGSFGTNQERIWVGDSHENFDYVFEANRFASDGFKKLDNGDSTGFDRRDIMGKFRWHTDVSSKVGQSITLKLVKSTEDGDEAYLGLTYEDYKNNPIRRYAGTQKDNLDLRHNHITLNYTLVPTKGLSIRTTGYYSDTFRDWGRINTAGGKGLNNILNDPTENQVAYQILTGQMDGDIDYQNAARSYFSKGIQSTLEYVGKTENTNHKFELGVRYHIDQADRYATRSTYAIKTGRMTLKTPGLKGNQENQLRNANALAVHSSYDLSFKGVTLSPGVRYEKIRLRLENFGNNNLERSGSRSESNELTVILPGMGINYEIDKSMNVFIGVHKGFSPPGPPSVTLSAESQAKAETSINYELGYRYEDYGLNTQVVGFYNDFDNILGSDTMSSGGVGSGDMYNAGKAKILGLEFSLTYDLLHKRTSNPDLKLPFGMSYTYTDATFQETFTNAGGDWGSGVINKGDLIPFITPHVWSGIFGIENKIFNIGLIARYIGPTKTKPGGRTDIKYPNQETKYSDINAIEAYWILDVSINWKFSKNFTIFSTVNNITNNKAIVASLPQGYRPNIPLSFNLGLKADF